MMTGGRRAQLRRSKHALAVLAMLLATLLAPPPVVKAQDDVVANVCTGLKDLCSTSIKLPVSATVETKQACTNKCCDWSCGQSRTIPNVCTGCSKPRCGEACVLGACTNKCCTWNCDTTIDIPCTGCSKARCGEACTDLPSALIIKYDEKTACDAAEAVTGVPVQKALAVCPCLGKVADFLKAAGDDPSRLKTELLASAGDLADCLVTSGFNVQSAKDSSLATLRADANRDIILEAPPIDVSFYLSLATAIAGCTVGATCEQIIDLFLKYFQEAGGVVGKGLVNYVQTTLVDGVFNTVLEPFKSLEQLAETLPDTLEEQISTCTGDATDTLKSAAKDLKRALSGLPRKFVSRGEDLVQTVRDAAEGLNSAVEALQKSYANHLQDIATSILSGKAPDFADGLSFLLKADDFANSMKSAAKFVESLPEMQEAVQAVGVAQSAIADAGSSCQLDLSALNPLKDAVNKLQGCADRLKTLSFDPANLQAGVVSYGRHIDVNLDMPCFKMESKDFEVAGLKAKSVEYPKFYGCTYTTKVPLPNEHIPYIRLKGLAIGASCGAK